MSRILKSIQPDDIQPVPEVDDDQALAMLNELLAASPRVEREIWQAIHSAFAIGMKTGRDQERERFDTLLSHFEVLHGGGQ